MEQRAITAAEEWFAERGVKKIFINSRTEAVGFYENLVMWQIQSRLQESSIQCI